MCSRWSLSICNPLFLSVVEEFSAKAGGMSTDCDAAVKKVVVEEQLPPGHLHGRLLPRKMLVRAMTQPTAPSLHARTYAQLRALALTLTFTLQTHHTHSCSSLICALTLTLACALRSTPPLLPLFTHLPQHRRPWACQHVGTICPPRAT